MILREDFPNFRQTLAASLLLHLAFFLLARGLPAFLARPEVEVEFFSPFEGTGPARLAPPKAKVMDRGIPLPAQRAEKPVQTAAKPPEPPKDWTAATPETKKTEKPPETVPVQGAVPNGTENAPSSGGVVGGTGLAPQPGGIDGHAAYGTPDGNGNGGSRASPPKLLNLDELSSLMRRYYPENERRAGREGDVLLKVHILADGTVGGSDIVHADADDFAVAAQKVALLMRFTPAMRGSTPVPSAINVPMQFRLRD